MLKATSPAKLSLTNQPLQLTKPTTLRKPAQPHIHLSPKSLRDPKGEIMSRKTKEGNGYQENTRTSREGQGAIGGRGRKLQREAGSIHTLQFLRSKAPALYLSNPCSPGAALILSSAGSPPCTSLLLTPMLSGTGRRERRKGLPYSSSVNCESSGPANTSQRNQRRKQNSPSLPPHQGSPADSR